MIAMPVRDGSVVEVRSGRRVPNGFVEIDLAGRYIYPGLIDLDSAYGLPKPEKRGSISFSSAEVLASPVVGAYNANQAIRSHYAAADHFKIDDEAAGKLRALGFGTVLTHMHDGIARGTGALVLLGADSDNEAVLESRASAHYSLDRGSSTQSFPISIMGAMALLRQTQLDARW